MPGGVASGMGGGALMQFNCADDEVCAPQSIVEDPTACFPRCNSVGGIAGACTAAFLVPVEFQALLPVDTCGAGYICSPCISPLTGSPTGACESRGN